MARRVLRAVEVMSTLDRRPGAPETDECCVNAPTERRPRGHAALLADVDQRLQPRDDPCGGMARVWRRGFFVLTGLYFLRKLAVSQGTDVRVSKAILDLCMTVIVRIFGPSRYRDQLMSAVRETLVVVDGRVTDEKLAELLDLQTEQPELDFKRIISPRPKPEQRCADPRLDEAERDR
jgi:hypothetical protein